MSVILTAKGFSELSITPQANIAANISDMYVPAVLESGGSYTNSRLRIEDLQTTFSGSVFSNGGDNFGGDATLGLTSSDNLDIITGSTSRIRFHSNGRIGFGTTVDSGWNFHFNGNARVAGKMYLSDGGTVGSYIQAAYENTIQWGSNNTARANKSIVIGYQNVFNVSHQLSMGIGWQNTLTAMGSIGIAIGTFHAASSVVSGGGNNIIGSSCTVDFNNPIQTFSWTSGRSVSNSHGWCAVYGSQVETTDTGQLIIAQSQSNTTLAGYRGVYFGTGVRSKNSDKVGVPVTINGCGAGDGTDLAGGLLRMAAGKSTGSATPPDFVIATASAGASGTTLQSITDRWFVKGETGILSNTSSPDTSCLVDLDSTTQLMGLMSMTGAEAEAISSPKAGGITFINNGNGATITSVGFWGYDGSTWTKL